MAWTSYFSLMILFCWTLGMGAKRIITYEVIIGKLNSVLIMSSQKCLLLADFSSVWILHIKNPVHQMNLFSILYILLLIHLGETTGGHAAQNCIIYICNTEFLLWLIQMSNSIFSFASGDFTLKNLYLHKSCNNSTMTVHVHFTLIHQLLTFCHIFFIISL